MSSTFIKKKDLKYPIPIIAAKTTIANSQAIYHLKVPIKRKIPRRIILKRQLIYRMRTGNFGFLYFEGMKEKTTISNIEVTKNNN